MQPRPTPALAAASAQSNPAGQASSVPPSPAGQTTSSAQPSAPAQAVARFLALNGHVQAVSSAQSTSVRLQAQPTAAFGKAVGQPKLVVLMAGMSMTGKSLIALKLTRYLVWLGYRTRTFHYSSPTGSDDVTLERYHVGAKDMLEQLLLWLQKGKGASVGILDTYNATVENRREIHAIASVGNTDVMFVESLVNESGVASQILDSKLQTPKYQALGREKAEMELSRRVTMISSRYQPLDMFREERHYNIIKFINFGENLSLHRIWGYLPGQIALYLTNMHNLNRKIWLSRHGESIFNARGLIGGDSELTLKGQAYAFALRDFLQERVYHDSNFTVYTSCLIRTQQTAAQLPNHYTFLQSPLLNEINAGSCDGMTYEEIKARFPDEHAKRKQDKFNYRYPDGGESYHDLVERLKPMVVEIERQRSPILVISHQAIMRVLGSYFLDDLDQEQCCTWEVPHNRLVELTPTAYGYEYRFVSLEAEVNAHYKRMQEQAKQKDLRVEKIEKLTAAL
eukprot:g64240.t1